MVYGKELVAQLQSEIALMKKTANERWERINDGMTDIDDCFISMRCEDRGISNNEAKIRLIENGGTDWFVEYATLDGHLVNAHWCDTKYGYKLRVVMPDGQVVWTASDTAKGLAKRGLKRVECRRPAWFAFKSSNSGMLGVYTGDYVMFPSDINYATGEEATVEPIEVRDYIE